MGGCTYNRNGGMCSFASISSLVCRLLRGLASVAAQWDALADTRVLPDHVWFDLVCGALHESILPEDIPVHTSAPCRCYYGILGVPRFIN